MTIYSYVWGPFYYTEVAIFLDYQKRTMIKPYYKLFYSVNLAILVSKSEYHGRWCPGSLPRLDISRHVYAGYTRSSTKCVISMSRNDTKWKLANKTSVCLATHIIAFSFHSLLQFAFRPRCSEALYGRKCPGEITVIVPLTVLVITGRFLGVFKAMFI